MNSEAPFNQLRFWLRLDDVSVLDVNKLTAQPEMELDRPWRDAALHQGLVRAVTDIYTLWLFNIAMENGPFIDDVPIKLSIYKGFSMAMLNNQR